jgi:drug/metabolite transporter (DMT)-like permease
LSRSVSHLRAIGFALVSFTFWVFTDTCMKVASEAGMPPYELMGLMGLSATLAMMALSAMRKETKKLRVRDWRPQALCAACSMVCTLSNAVALKHLPLTVFYIVVFTAPMVTAILAALFLKERLSPIKIMAVLAGFIGVLVAVNAPQTPSSTSDWIGYAAASTSVAAYSIWTIRMRGMTQSESLESIAFFSGMSLASVGLVWTFLDLHRITMAGIGLALLSGLFNLSGNLCNYKALKHTTAGNVLQIHYSQIITGAIMAYFIWGDVPTWGLSAGAIIIIGSGLVIAAQAHKTKPLPPVNL